MRGLFRGKKKDEKLLAKQQEFEQQLFPGVKERKKAKQKRHNKKPLLHGGSGETAAGVEEQIEQQLPEMVWENLYDTRDSYPIIEYLPSEEESESASLTPSFVLELTWPRIIQFYHPSSPHCRSLQPIYVAVARGIKRRSSRLPVEFHALNCGIHRDVCEQTFNIQSVPTFLGLRSGAIEGNVISLPGNMEGTYDSKAYMEKDVALKVEHIANAMGIPLDAVVSDIDDTLKSSGGVTVAGVTLGGVDVQYSRGDFYPGVFQFMWELSLHSVLINERYYDEHAAGKNRGNGGLSISPPKVAVLTARAEEFKAALEIKDESKLAQAFRRTGEASAINPTKGWGVGPVLYGSVSEWVMQYKKGLRKFNNFERLLEQDPTGQIMQYIYVGDTGELDQEAGETMLREYPEVVQAVFLHVVSADPPSTYPPSGLPIPAPKLVNGRPLVFFRTYVGAAAKATQLGLMEPNGLLRVVEEAEKSLKAQGVPESNNKWTDIARDVDEAYRTLGEMF
ncbi:hypothetical protein ACHAXT_007726 [Thalassiosira profunda]